MIARRSQGAVRGGLIWVGLAALIVAPVIIAALSPLLAWRDPVYISSGFAGVLAMAALLLQPLLAAGLPGLSRRPARRVHGWIGLILVALVIVHVGGLWLTSPPDVVDALLLRSPTPFSLWGVVAMWAVFASALLAAFRRRLRPVVWRLAHAGLGASIVSASVAHALLIQGTMGTVSKAVLCVAALLATAKVLRDMRPWAPLLRRVTRTGGRP